MQRTALTDNSGRWFNVDQAEKFNNRLIRNGNNRISAVTGKQWAHETIFRTSGGRWILNCWSETEGIPETYEEVSQKQAASWLVINEIPDNEIPDEILLHIDALEL